MILFAFYLQTRCVFTGYFWFVKMADNRDILSKYSTFKEILNSAYYNQIINCTACRLIILFKY